ncbi:MAG: TolC family protein [Desulfobacteraceae bacterium]|nr:TolC family protein [Desulfobacteraceae bacterium]
MHFIIHVMIAMVFLCISFTSSSAETFSTEISETQVSETPAISDFIVRAYHGNPSIQAARENWKAAVENYRLATGYPDPQVMLTYFPQPIETRLGPQDWNASISQMIPFPGKLSKAGEVAKADVRIARLNLDKTVRDITVSIFESVHELIYIRKAKQIAAQNTELLDHLRKTAETAYARDRAAFVDVVKAQSQTAQLRYDTLLLDELEKTEITKLNGLLNRPPDSPVGGLEKIRFQPLVYELEDIYRLAEEGQEEIKMAEVKVAKAKAKADLAVYQNMPNFKMGIFYAGIGNPDVSKPPDDAGQDAVGVQFGMSIPLWAGKNSGRIELAKAQTEKSKAEKNNRIIKTRTNIRNLFFRLQNARRLITLYRDEMLPQAAGALETAETWFRQEQGSFSDFSETQSVLYNFQLSLARAYADYGKYLARLEKLAGRSLTEKEEK